MCRGILGVNARIQNPQSHTLNPKPSLNPRPLAPKALLIIAAGRLFPREAPGLASNPTFQNEIRSKLIETDAQRIQRNMKTGMTCKTKTTRNIKLYGNLECVIRAFASEDCMYMCPKGPKPLCGKPQRPCSQGQRPLQGLYNPLYGI